MFGSYGHSGLTPAMRRLEAQLEHGQLLRDTESYALKPPDLFKERLADLILRHPDKSADELADEVHDGIRYACIVDTEHYADATLQAAHATAAEIAANPPLTVRGIKDVLDQQRVSAVSASLRYVAAWNAAFLPSKDLSEGISATFAKRPPQFTGE